jgi:oligogalacturonide transporter
MTGNQENLPHVPPVEGRKPRLRNYISYGVGDFLGGGSFILIGTLYMFFMTEVVGMAPFWAGLLVFIGKLWDAVSDPLMGYISDRTRSRFGRRRVYFLAGMVPVFVFFAALWAPVKIQSQPALFSWYLLIFLLFSTAYTVLMVPYIALNAEISLDYKVRARFSGFKQLAAGFSGALCLIASQPIVKLFPDDQAHTGYLVMGITYGLFFSLPWLAVYFGTWEPPLGPGAVRRQTTAEILANFYSVFKNRSFRVHIGMYVFAFAGMDCVMALFLYYLTYYLRQPAFFPRLMVFFVLAQGAALPVYIKIGNVYGKGRAFMAGGVTWLAGLLVVLALPPAAPPLPVLIAGTVLLGAGICGATTMPWVMLPSIADVDELITATKRAGTYAGMMTLFRKTVSAAVMLTVGAVLGAIGFVKGAENQAPETVSYLRLIFFLGPFTAVLGGLAVSFKFKITPFTHRLLRQEIRRLANGGSRDSCDAETRRVCELLSGLNYRDLYQSGSIGEALASKTGFFAEG